MNRFPKRNRPRFRRYRGCRGVVSIDTAVGLAMVVALAGTLAAVAVQHRKADQAMAQRREAAYRLETQAGLLRAGQTLDDTDTQLTAAGDDWVRLSCPAGRGEVELYVYLPGHPAPRTEDTP